MDAPATIAPDTKDWTWVLTRPCPACGLDAGRVPVEELADRLRATAGTWRARLAAPDAAQRPAPATWAPLEYGAHVRDVLVLARTRLTALLTEDDPLFADWDQDATAARGRYLELAPGAVADAVEQGAAVVGALLERVRDGGHGDPGAAWARPGRRSDGSVFTVVSLARYVLHDVVHHEADVLLSDPGRPAAPR